MIITSRVLLAIGAYLLGAVPFGFLIARSRGIDIRKAGSGNIGATNVFRAVGKGWGALTLLLDALKGLIPAALFPLLLGRMTQGEPAAGDGVLFACLAIAGHNWPIYLKFKGGKGIATTGGAVIGIAPAAFGVGLATWIVTCLVTRYVSVASILAAAAIPTASWLWFREDGILVPCILTLLGAMAILRHHGNIRRLLKGTENRFTFKKKEKQADA